MFFLGLMLSIQLHMKADELPSYFVKIIQERTLFASDEPVMVIIRVGNQSERSIQTKRLPNVLEHLVVMEGEKQLAFDKKEKKNVYRKLAKMEMGYHKDFRFNLRKYFPDMKPGGIYSIYYKDDIYNLTGNKINIAPVAMPDLNADYVVRTSFGSFTIKLEAEQAPQHARNFAILSALEFYRNMEFHRVERGFVIQTGDPIGTGEGGSGFPLALEKSPFLKHEKYAVGMARAEDPNSATSQFYICLNKVEELDQGYTVFGHVVSGEDVVDSIGLVATNGPNGEPPNKPLDKVRLMAIDIVQPENGN